MIYFKAHEDIARCVAADKKDELLDRLQVLNTTDMALIVSPSQNEIDKMHKLGLAIQPHRKRMNDSQPL